MKQKIALLTGIACLVVFSGGLASAGNPHDSSNPTGQPSQSCQVTTVTPGNAASAPGSAFNPGGVAGSQYAGTQPQNSKNPNSVAQYDVACFQQTGRVP
jgi:hypothetical protein